MIRGYKNLASLLAVYAEIPQATQLTQEGLAAATRLGDAFHVAWFRVELATYAYLRGDWDEALEQLESFVAALGDKRHYMEGPAHSIRGRIAAERGDSETGMAESARALEFARSLDEAQQLLPALASHARVLVRAGRDAEASTLLDELLAVARQPTPALGDAAAALVDLGRAADVDRLSAAVRATRWGRPANALAHGDYAQAAELYAAAGATVLEADARERLAAALDARGAHAEARRERELAADVFGPAGALKPSPAHAAA
jgi:ATP/maltotriose-dependent transcriptional regulator MalT